MVDYLNGLTDAENIINKTIYYHILNKKQIKHQKGCLQPITFVTLFVKASEKVSVQTQIKTINFT